MKSSTIQLLVAGDVEYGLIVKQVDVGNAHIQSEFKECIYTNPPPGYKNGSKMCLNRQETSGTSA